MKISKYSRFFRAELSGFRLASQYYGKSLHVPKSTALVNHLRLIIYLIIPFRPYKKNTIYSIDLSYFYHPCNIAEGSTNAYKVIESKKRITSLFTRYGMISLLFPLIHSPSAWIFSIRVKKIFLGLLLAKTVRCLSNVPTFLVRDDIRSGTSILASMKLAWDNIDTIFVQHGIYRLKPKIFIGARSSNHIIYDEKYIPQYLEHIKDFNYSIRKPPSLKDTSNQYDSSSTLQKRLIFVSGYDLPNPQRREQIFKLADLAVQLDIEFCVRPHHKELKYKHKYFDNKIKVLSPPLKNYEKLSRHNTIFIGFFSTLLFEMACSGFRTIWLESIDCPTNRDFYQIVPDIANTHFSLISSLNIATLEAIFQSPISPSKDAKISLDLLQNFSLHSRKSDFYSRCLNNLP